MSPAFVGWLPGICWVLGSLIVLGGAAVLVLDQRRENREDRAFSRSQAAAETAPIVHQRAAAADLLPEPSNTLAWPYGLPGGRREDRG